MKWKLNDFTIFLNEMKLHQSLGQLSIMRQGMRFHYKLLNTIEKLRSR